MSDREKLDAIKKRHEHTAACLSMYGRSHALDGESAVEDRATLLDALEAAEAQLLDTTWQDHADHWQKRAVAAEAREKRMRSLLLKAATYVELTASEELGEESAEAKGDLDEINAALAGTAP